MKAALNQLVRSPSTPQGVVQRSRIVLAAAAGKSNQQIAGELHMPEVTVGKWRRSFAQQGLQGLEDAPRSGRPVMHGPEIVQRVQTRVCEQPEHYSRWSVRTLAEDLKLPRSTVHQILVASNLQPHRIRTFTFSPDPDFEARLLDVVGLYLNPPENALVLCVDEKTGIQALDRTQPLLPLRAKKPRSWTNEYVRHGTQTLLAALEIASGQVVAHVKQRRTTVNFLRFLKDVIAAFPERELHIILDNLNIHKNRAARNWLKRHPRVPFITPRPTLPGSIWWNAFSASWVSRHFPKASILPNVSSRNSSWTISLATTKIPGRSYGPRDPKSCSASSRRQNNIKQRTRANHGSGGAVLIL